MLAFYFLAIGLQAKIPVIHLHLLTIIASKISLHQCVHAFGMQLWGLQTISIIDFLLNLNCRLAVGSLSVVI